MPQACALGYTLGRAHAGVRSAPVPILAEKAKMGTAT